MAIPKKYDRRTINFGAVNNPARLIAEAIVEKHGKTSLSSFVRRAMRIVYSDDPQFAHFKGKEKLLRFKEVKKSVARGLQERAILEIELKEIGFSEEELSG